MTSIYFLAINAYLFNFELNRFLIALSVLPGSSLAISDHLFPCLRWMSKMILSSSSLHLSFLIEGSKWLCHLSLHYLPTLPGKSSAILLQFLGPFSVTIFSNCSSSSVDQAPLFRGWFESYFDTSADFSWKQLELLCSFPSCCVDYDIFWLWLLAISYECAYVSTILKAGGSLF